MNGKNIGLIIIRVILMVIIILVVVIMANQYFSIREKKFHSLIYKNSLLKLIITLRRRLPRCTLMHLILDEIVMEILIIVLIVYGSGEKKLLLIES